MTDDKREETGKETGTAKASEADNAKAQKGPAGEAPGQAEAAKAEAAPAEPTPDEQLAEMKDKLLRAMAEVENIRRRSEREKADAQKFGISRFARDLLSVADNLRRAIDAVPEEKRENLDGVTRNLITGVEMVERELLAVFERHGIKALRPDKGTKFDPNLHQAMAQVPDPGAPAGSVSDVFQTGYVIEDRLLRPAMVTVAKAPENDESGTSEQKTAKQAKPGKEGRPEPGAKADSET